MFTGVIEALGKVKNIIRKSHSVRLSIEADKTVKIGDSVSINGICLTVVGTDGSSFDVDVVSTTLKGSNIGSLKIGDKVNLERPTPPQGYLSGHFVLGHIDGIGIIKRKIQKGDSFELEISYPPPLKKFIVEKGSIAVDGVSLTVAGLKEDRFGIAIIPHTAKFTTIGSKRIGDAVNLEVDILGKYVERQLSYAK